MMRNLKRKLICLLLLSFCFFQFASDNYAGENRVGISLNPNNTQEYISAKVIWLNDTNQIQRNIKMIEDFYKEYMSNILSDQHSNVLLKKKYLTKNLIEKIDRIVFVTGADPVIRAQDITKNAIETLKVRHLSENWYMVDYKWNANDNTVYREIPLRTLQIDGKKMIDFITPEWNGSLYGEMLLCKNIPPASILNSSPQFMLESFYAIYTSIYYNMAEGILPKLATLRTNYLTSNALNQFESAAKEFRLDGLSNYDLLIDNFDFDCLWIPSMNFTQLEKNSYKIIYKQGKLEKSLIVTLIFSDGEYKIDNINV